MSEIVPHHSSLPAAPAEVEHILGPVADDWAAIEVWLQSVAANGRNGSTETIKTYRYHLAKLRWYCERVVNLAPGRWSMQDAQAFRAYLADLPPAALCARVGRRYAEPGEAGHSPFRKQPAPSSQADILRFVHAMFGALHGAGYLRRNPVAMMTVRKERRLDASRAIELDVYDTVLRGMELDPALEQGARRLLLRDRFVLIALRELGLRAAELAGADMAAFERVSDPKNGRTYWVLRVDAATAKGGIARSVPVTQTALDALMAYRVAFNLSPLPARGEQYALLLSPRTEPVPLGRGFVRTAEGRRFFGAWGSIRTRHGLYRVVKLRLGETARALAASGERERAEGLLKASPHWLRHTFAKAQLLGGIDIRQVAGALGHASVDTTMAYTDQQALDLIRGMENAQPGKLAGNGVDGSGGQVSDASPDRTERYSITPTRRTIETS